MYNNSYAKRLKKLLKQNYKALGFTLEGFEVFDDDSGDVVRGYITCPCGGQECFAVKIEHGDEYFLPSAEQVAIRILSRTASREHLLEDVENGTLPAMDVDKHCFNGKLIGDFV